MDEESENEIPVPKMNENHDQPIVEKIKDKTRRPPKPRASVTELKIKDVKVESRKIIRNLKD